MCGDWASGVAAPYARVAKRSQFVQQKIIGFYRKFSQRHLGETETEGLRVPGYFLRLPPVV